MEAIPRRDALKLMAAAAAIPACSPAKPTVDSTPVATAPSAPEPQAMEVAMAVSPNASSDPAPAATAPVDPVLRLQTLGQQWPTEDPFLFCVYHLDDYPAGTEAMGPVGSLAGRRIGQDFANKDGWNMYHGDVVPGFPRHPHRGFETVTVVRKGVLDHFDSMGASARYGGGDVQWLTAGAGIQHSEMMPLLTRDAGNPLELFQIWLNLPPARKMVAPHFTMFWDDKIPRVVAKNADGAEVRVTIVAGALDATPAPSPPPDSWASEPGVEMAIWTIKMDAGTRWTVPSVGEGVRRSLYLFDGDGVTLGPRAVIGGQRIQVHGEAFELHASAGPVEMLLLQGRPIGAPVAARGPFVMNTQEELQQAFSDYRRTGFGAWPWDRADPVHPGPQGRFAHFADGKTDKPG